jgi:AcrR family transcriptional regulator
MRSVLPDDRSTPAIIRDAALALFAESGPEHVTVRQIAAAANVSTGLVGHHFGSKDNLRDRVDEYVAATFDALFETFDAAPPEPGEDLSGSLADALLAGLPAGSPIPAYLRRLWLAGDDSGRRLFRRWYQASLAWIERLERHAIVRPSPDPRVRCAILMLNDLSVLLFRDHLADVLDIDTMSAPGMRRWAAEAIDLYQGGLFTGEQR